MSTTMRESSHVSRKYVSHGGGNGGGAISGQGHSGNASSNSLENNLDALLEDLQTSVSRSTTPSRGGRAKSPQVEYRSAANTSKTVSEVRSLSPARSKTTTTEKFVSSGPAGIGSGIPGLEALDAELRNVQPGQSKTVAYKQVSYAYNKNLDGKPIGVTDSYTLSDNSLTSGVPLIDDIHETSYEESRLHRRHRSPEPVIKSSTTVNRELLFDDSYTTPRSKQTSPLPGTQSRDLKFTRESNFQTDVRPVQTINTSQEFGTVEYVPVPSPTPAVPINLAPGPNTKVTTTIKTYTYELPGAPDTYLPGTTSSNSSSTTLQKNVHLAGDQKITYTLPRGGSLERPNSPTRYASSPIPPEVTQKSKILHKEAKYYQEEIHGYPPGKPTTTYTSGPPGTNLESTITRNEYYRQADGNYPNGYGPDRPDHTGGSNTTIIYQNQHQPPPTINETHTTTTIDRFEEHYPNRPSSAGRPDYHKPATPTRSTTVNYYNASPPLTTPPQTNTTVYKYSNTTTVVPPGHHPDDHEVLLPKPFPTGIQVYPSNGKPSTNNGQGPPAKLEDLMASFSDSEREVLDDIAKQENYQRKDRVKDTVNPKKEVDFVPHTPAQLQSKNVAGPPVYYPPGSAEFTKKESAEGGMSQSGGAWAKGRGNYEYAASEKSRSKSSSGKAVIPVCLPLCCGLPCVIL